jgi:hypothetical protein
LQRAAKRSGYFDFRVDEKELLDAGVERLYYFRVLAPKNLEVPEGSSAPRATKRIVG